MRAVLLHRMMACCEPGSMKIRDQSFFIAHWIERREQGRWIGVICSDVRFEKRACGAGGAFDLPAPTFAAPQS